MDRQNPGVGSVVRLKSGGPRMTVTGVVEAFGIVQSLNCTYEADGVYEAIRLAPECVVLEDATVPCTAGEPSLRNVRKDGGVL